MTTPALLTEAQVAARLHVTVRTLRAHLARHPEVPHIRIGRKRLFTESDYADLLAALRAGSSPPTGASRSPRPAPPPRSDMLARARRLARNTVTPMR